MVDWHPMRLSIALAAACALLAQAKDPVWEAVASLAGEWEGEGQGEPGVSKGGFTFTPDLQGKILVRRNRSEYSATKDRAAFAHEDLMIFYRDPASGKVRASYHDNEGHLIEYTVTAEGRRIAFVSNAATGEPRYRFTYEEHAQNGASARPATRVLLARLWGRAGPFALMRRPGRTG